MVGDVWGVLLWCRIVLPVGLMGLLWNVYPVSRVCSSMPVPTPARNAAKPAHNAQTPTPAHPAYKPTTSTAQPASPATSPTAKSAAAPQAANSAGPA